MSWCLLSSDIPGMSAVQRYWFHHLSSTKPKLTKGDSKKKENQNCKLLRDKKEKSSFILPSVLCMLSHFSHVRLFVIPWTAAHQAPLSLGFSRQEHWGGLLCPPLADLPNPGIKPTSPATSALQADSLPLSLQIGHLTGFHVIYNQNEVSC